MAEKTTNFGLTKPLPEEFYDVAVQNENMDIIDEKLKEAFESGGGGTPNEINAMSIGTDRTAIPENADLNDYTAVGGFKCALNGTAATLANCPVQVAFTMDVVSSTGDWDKIYPEQYSYVMQRIHAMTGDEYFRTVSSNGAGNINFGAWFVHYNTNHPPTPAEIGAFPIDASTPLKGTLIVDSGDSSDVKNTADNVIGIETESPDGAAYKRLYVANSKLLSLEESVYIVDKPEGATGDVRYKLYGEHNKDVLRSALFTASTTDLTAGTSTLETGKIYLVYE